MSENILRNALWLAHPLFLTGIGAVMFRRGLNKKFKFFFAYIVIQLLAFAITYPYRNNHFAYFYLYWVSHAIDVVLGFGVIHEVFIDVFRPFHTLRDLGTVLFKWAGLVMLLVAGVVSVSNTASSDVLPWMQAIMTTERCVRLIQVGMVLFLLFFSQYVGVSKRQHSFGIALGFGMIATVELILISSFAGDHLDESTVSLINMVAYNVTLLTWLGYTISKSSVREVAGATLFKPQRWEQSLTDIHNPAPADSLIPMFEGMVDRALSRTQISLPPEPPAAAPPAEKSSTVATRTRTALPVA